jgi:hypothetical protein
MKRCLILAAILLIASYAITYRALPYRNASRFRHAEVFVHVRDFHHEWQARLFYPAAYIEWLLVRILSAAILAASIMVAVSSGVATRSGGFSCDISP